MASRTITCNDYSTAWTTVINYQNIEITGDTFKLSDMFTGVTGKWAYRTSGDWDKYPTAKADVSIAWSQSGNYPWTFEKNYKRPFTNYGETWLKNTTKDLYIYNDENPDINTALFFNSNNPTDRTVTPTLSAMGSFEKEEGWGAEYPSFSWQRNTYGDLVLNVPPTFSYDPVAYDTPWIYAGLTTASVDLDDITAYYGGYITEAKLTIGSQTAILTGDDTDILSSGTLSILLNAVGTFTPTLTVTDSRGQVKTETLESITVLGYVNPSVSLGIERTDNTGAPADEGTYAVLTAKFTFTDAVATLSEPVVTGGTSVTWYTTRSSAGVVSNPVDWNDTSGISSGDTLYGLVGTFSPNQSYVISVEPKDSEGTGTSVSITLATAFFTIDFLAGGHGIAFGKPAVTDDLFECDLDAQFNKDVSIGRALTVTETASTENLLLQLDTSGASGTIDDDIYADLVALGWDTDVIV